VNKNRKDSAPTLPYNKMKCIFVLGDMEWFKLIHLKEDTAEQHLRKRFSRTATKTRRRLTK